MLMVLDGLWVCLWADPGFRSCHRWSGDCSCAGKRTSTIGSWLTATSAMPKLRRKEPRSAATFLAVKGKKIALVRHSAALEDDCRSADIVIAPFTIGKRCRAARVIIDRRMLPAEGAYALYLEGLSIRAESVAEARGRRPWGPDRAVVKTAPSRRLEATTRRHRSAI